MSALWTSVEAVAATGGRSRGPDWEAGGISIDSRALAPGDLFVALTDRRDGHDFVAAAFAGGACAALVSRVPEGIGKQMPLLVVEDTLEGLRALARAARARTRAQVVGVTGSVGKTSVKEMLRLALSGQARVHAAEQSFNNHWGVPLTLARMPRETEVAVIEMGMNHAGEIAPLSRLARPDVALVTAIAPAHIEAFPDGLQGIARAKAEIFEGLAPGGVALLPAGATGYAILEAAAREAGAQIVSFGTARGADLRLEEVLPGPGGTTIRARLGAERLLFKIAASGVHFASGALAALGAVRGLGLDVPRAALDLASWAPPAGRGARREIVLDAVEEHTLTLIDDAYNANPASVAAALDALAASAPLDHVGRVGRGRRIAILGDMLELGAQGPELHAGLARHSSLAAVDIVHCAGPLMRHLHDALPREKRGEWHETAESLAARVRHLLDAGDVVLVKGSKGARTARVVDAIDDLGQAPSTLDGDPR